MKRIFTIVTLISCVLVAFSWSAQASMLQDGVTIYVGLSEIEHEDVKDFHPSELTSGSITYDETNHVLSLEGAVINGRLWIDATKLDESTPFTIHVGTSEMSKIQSRARTRLSLWVNVDWL